MIVHVMVSWLLDGDEHYENINKYHKQVHHQLV